MSKKILIGASIGNCVHVAGVAHFLSLAEKEGYEIKFLGPAVSIECLFENINKYRPDMVAIGYRLTPENVKELLLEIDNRRKNLNYEPIWIFGGTKPVAKVAKAYKMFSYISDGIDDINDSIRFLRGDKQTNSIDNHGQTLVERINENYPYPIIRHHFGLPNLEQTIKGIEKISKAKVLDVISIGPDQNAQQYFFNQKNMKKQFDGAGGVPVRTTEDLIDLKKASKCGNYPLMRCYSGTEDVFKYASMLVDTIENAWTAIPLSWYSELDGRGTRPIEKSIIEAQQLIKWHADRNIPVEINEPHHWGLRDAHDVIPVAMAYISAYNAKKLGVKHYISQYMFNNPNGISFSMDLARILAMIELVESLEDENFKTYRETRAGLPLFSADIDVAKGQLAASTFMQMAIKPHIIHVVAYCEADHAASANDVIASCKIVKGVIKHTISDTFSMEKDEKIIARKDELVKEAKVLLSFIKDRFSNYGDPLSNAEVLSQCIKNGYIDAVHIVKNSKFNGNLATKFVEGKCVAYDKETGEILDEDTRLKRLLEMEQITNNNKDEQSIKIV
ncbi:cobalamin B12-binding domain-containing protein [Clostridium sp. UBA5988]|uniref:cobalamin B12-binding domain-containing protein n=1 Tax=Clostridium sp. UBA5988 TaxID=1946369 RepID=UPI0032177C40